MRGAQRSDGRRLGELHERADLRGRDDAIALGCLDEQRIEVAAAERRGATGMNASLRATNGVLAQLARGASNKDIATKLGCATRTVEVHATAVMRRCHVESRSRLVSVFSSY